MTERDIERWSREVAENPGASPFVRLARAYRAQGRSRAARSVVLRGLEQNPEHIAAHGLLALIHVEDGERERAGDEWQIMLRLDPGNFEASRGLGFLALERNDLETARRHLEQAEVSQPGDTAVTQALQVLRRRERDGTDPAGRHGARAEGTATTTMPPGPGAGVETAIGAPSEEDAPVRVRDPEDLFDVLWEEAPFLGAVVLDARGLVVAGTIELEGAGDELLGALINTAVEEARRASAMVGLGEWGGMTLDCDDATLHVAGLPGEAVVLMATRSDAPTGWAARTARRARSLAQAFLEERA